MIPIAANDVDYRENPDTQNWEHRLVTKMFSVSSEGIFQGIYVGTPSGKLLARCNAGWPDPDANETLNNIKKAVAKYYAMPKSERLLANLPNPTTDRLKFKEDQFTKPKGTLDLRVTKRGYAYPGMTSFDERHPMFFGIDRLWFKPSELQTLLPGSLTVGSSKQVNGPMGTRWVLHNHMQKAASAWDEPHIQVGIFTSTVKEVSGSKVNLEIKAHYELKANTQWNTGSYRGDLLGKLTIDSRSLECSAFEATMFGRSTLGKLLPNAHAGDPSQMVASYITINPQTDADDNMIPSNWMWGYGLNWCQSR